MSRGFSSLVDLYKTSGRFADVTGSAYLNGSEDEQAVVERESGNLLILIDQFEEFFTNPENFPGGVPSQESRLLLNIILETAKISLKENLPIYIVCTMRSDYIGQCAAFRGLPEFIGFSQFFVPRLQRKELYQVIEEPAILSGNRISKRLIDRLIVDVEEGTDQLPILQHALKEIWKAASSGQEEMDLLHYAMVGGMPGETLPKEVKEKFESWKEQLPEHEKSYLDNPGLANVLDIHASKLYEGAAAHCALHGHPEITAKQARFIIAMSFACLTRIDESRAVRNRMTLLEITQIINSPSCTIEVVGTVLSIFREPENTLVRPFILEENANYSISADDVFDITHEALIRNWKLLKKWADQEFNYYNTFLDFQKQVDRWKENGKSDDFLLPIGPLTYFENWYKKCRPNQYWINRYHTVEERKDHRLNQSAIILKNGKEYLRKSALRLFVTRAFMKYGAGRITAVVGAIVFIVFSSFAVYNWRIRQNDYVIESILKEGEELLKDRELISFDHAFFLAEAERLSPGYLKKVLPKLPEQQRINIAINFPVAFLIVEMKNPPAIVRQNLLVSDSLIKASGQKLDSTSVTSINRHISNINGLVRNLSVFLYYNPDKEINSLIRQYARQQAILLQRMILQKRPIVPVDMKVWHIAITDAMNFNGFTLEERNQLIAVVSPLEGKPFATSRFNEWFPVGEKIAMGVPDNFSHNGGYQALAYLYASTGNVPRTLQCIDSLKKYNQNYDKARINSTHISIGFFAYGYQTEFKQFVNAYAGEVGMKVHRYVKSLLDKSSISTAETSLKFIKSGNFNSRFVFISDEERKRLFVLARELTKEELKSGDELYLNLALLNKLEGVLIAKKEQERGVISTTPDSLFRVALSYYNRVSVPFLNERVELQVQNTFARVEKRNVSRKHQFLYLDNFKTNETDFAPSDFNFYNDAFFHFLLKNNLFSKLYKGAEDFELITTWISRFFSGYGQMDYRGALHYPDPGTKTFEQIDSLITQSGFDLDNAWVKMKLISNHFEAGDTARAYRKIQSLKFKTLEKPEWDQAAFFKNMVIYVASELAIRGKKNDALKLIGNFSNRKNRVKAYAAIAKLCFQNNEAVYGALFLDSAHAEMSRLKTYTFQGTDFRAVLAMALTLQNTKESERKALEYLSVMQRYDRASGFINVSSAFAFLGNCYKAKSILPVYASAIDKIAINQRILFYQNLKKSSTEEWNAYVKIQKRGFNFFSTQNDLLPD